MACDENFVTIYQIPLGLIVSSVHQICFIFSLTCCGILLFGEIYNLNLFNLWYCFFIQEKNVYLKLFLSFESMASFVLTEFQNTVLFSSDISCVVYLYRLNLRQEYAIFCKGLNWQTGIFHTISINSVFSNQRSLFWSSIH